MKNFEEFLSESLAAEVKNEPKTAASKEARKLGLTYMGFGRYADRTGKVAYLVHNDKLVPYKGREEIQSMYSKSLAPSAKKVDAKGKEKPNEAEFYNKALTKREKEDSKIVKQKSKEIMDLNNQLYKFYKPNMFDNEELDAINFYTADGYLYINRYLYKGHDPDVSQDEADQLDAYISAMDSAFEETQAPFDYTVYTGLSARYKAEKLMPGQEYLFRGYISSSIDFGTAIDGFADTDWSDAPVVLQLEVKKGQKSIYIDSVSANAGEMETLLPRGSRIKIISGSHPIDDSVVSENPKGASIQLFHCELVKE